MAHVRLAHGLSLIALLTTLGAAHTAHAACVGGTPNGIPEAGEACDDGNTDADDGCSATCTEEAGYKCTEPVNFTALTVENYKANDARWTLDPNGRVGTQTFNSEHATIGLVGAGAFGVTYTFLMGVTMSTDDDAYGLVISFAPGSSTNPNADYLLLDWRRANQNHNPMGNAKIGMALSRVTGIPTQGNFWAHTSSTNGAVTELRRATSRGTTGWAVGTNYNFAVTQSSSSLQVTVNGTTEFDVTAEELGYTGGFPAGQVGFYGMSQDNVRYELLGPLASICSAVCGDGLVRGTEACDDDNTTNGDGCSSTCAVERGYDCPGEPSVCTPICGNGIVTLPETCDDGNTSNGDGCSSTCTVERGYDCPGAPSVCSVTCGNGIVTLPETCDDGNTSNGDGCSATCTVEVPYTCTGEPSVCTPICGNGVVTPPETCDDNNTTAGDGCSATCAVEPGYTCTGAPSVCSATCGNGVITAPEACDDDNIADGDGCSSTCTIEPGYSCTGEPSVCTFVGVDAGTDAGDDGGPGDAGSSDAGRSDSGLEDDGGVSTDAGDRDAGDGDDDDALRNWDVAGGGCGCSVLGVSDGTAATWLSLAGLGLVMARRRARRLADRR